MNQLARYLQLAASGEAAFLRDAPPLFLARYRSTESGEVPSEDEAVQDFGEETTQVGPATPAEGSAGALIELFGLQKKPKAPFAEMITIGRTDSNDVAIHDSGVSRLHAYVTPNPAGWTVADAGSRNGTHLDGQRLEPRKDQPLRSGSTLVFGGVAYLVLDAVQTYRALSRPA